MRCAVALGSNVGDRLAHLRAGIKAISELHEGAEEPLFSKIYETDAVDCEPGTAAYLNAVAEIETGLSPEVLLARLQQIEQAEGRPVEHGHNAPRTLDLDLLYAGNRVIHNAVLTLPHPRITARRFVLQPLADIRPDLVLPGARQTVAELMAGLPPLPGVNLFHP